MNAGRPGLFGKLPAKGDFITRDLPAPVLQAFEGWLQQVMAGARNDAGPHWQGAWAAAPVWRFWIGPDVFGTACAGAMMTSRDRVGRLFPLLFILPDKGRDFPPPPVMDPGEGWYGLLEARLRAAFALADLPDPAALLEGLGPDELPEWHPPQPDPESAAVLAEDVVSEDAVASAPPPDPAIWDSAAPVAVPEAEDGEAEDDAAPEASGAETADETADEAGAGGGEAAEDAPDGAEEATADGDAAGEDGGEDTDPEGEDGGDAVPEAAGDAADEDAPDEDASDPAEEGADARLDAPVAGAEASPELPEGDDSPFADGGFVPPDPSAFPDFPPLPDPEPQDAAARSDPDPDPDPDLAPAPIPAPALTPEAPAAAAAGAGPAGPAPELWPSLPRREEDPARALWAMAEGDDPVSLLADVAGADHLRAAARRSYWWTNGGGRGPAAMIAIEGMPDTAAFGLLIRGGR